MKKFEVIEEKNGERFTVYATNRLYDFECFLSEQPFLDDSGLTIQDNRPEIIKELNAMSKDLAKQIEMSGGVNPSYERMVDKIMNDPDNVWVDETDFCSLMESFVSLQQHVLECLRAKRRVRKIIRSFKNQ